MTNSASHKRRTPRWKTTAPEFRKALFAIVPSFFAVANELAAIFLHPAYRVYHIIACAVLLVWFLLVLLSPTGANSIWRSCTGYLILLIFLVLTDSLWWIAVGCAEVLICAIAVCLAERLRPRISK